jgi:3-oxoacyl-[acyl-carrier-protein] synthase II
MAIYIKSSEAITAQNTFNTIDILSETITIDSNYLECLSPDFKEHLDVKLLRRMTKILKIGVTSAKVCTEKSKISIPDAIIVGTGMGCIEDTAKFLNQIIDNDEQLLNPTPFIQSTHNTISGQIALIMQCKNYNLTFTQKSHSFEHALIDGCMLLKDNEARNVLVGGIDEIIDASYKLMSISGCINESSEIKPGEGSTFFIISTEKNEYCKSELKNVAVYNNMSSHKFFKNYINDFLKMNDLSFNDIDFVVSGMDENSTDDKFYKEFMNIFSNCSIAKYKHLVGEYDTVSSFGLFLANNIIANNRIPKHAILIDKKIKLNIGIALNFSKGKDLSILLLSKC